MRVLSIMCLGLVVAGAGCSGDAGDNGGGDGPDETCEDPAYGDGTCDLDLSCEAPDIDCYILFADHAEAEDWFAGIEEQIAASQFRPPRALLPESDSHHVRMRALLEEGWDAYKQVNAVGDLAARPPELVVVEDPSVNAFVQGDGEKAGFAVMVHTGLIDIASDEELVSIVMHELTHAIFLHVIPPMKDRVRIHYLARDGEPFGFEQSDDPAVRTALTDWRALAADVGPMQSAPLVGFPMPLGNGVLFRVYTAAARVWSEANPEACATPMAAVAELTSDILSYYSTIDQKLHVEGLEASLMSAQNSALVAMRDQCMAGLTDGYVSILAQLNGKTEEEMREMMPDEDEALVDGKHFIEAIATLINDRR
ncbi:MAG TPA: M48 family metalloprotease, partial [Kofleriaceae bacterium]|nr:M48 family metalloprotease [Kofleriaceae bacterium]